MAKVFHITTSEVWEKARKAGIYEGDTLSSEGFIHCSTKEQLIEVANRVYKGRRGLVLLLINEQKIESEVRYEDAGNEQFYPHIYGPLNVDAVDEVVSFSPMDDGYFDFPETEERDRPSR